VANNASKPRTMKINEGLLVHAARSD